MNIRFRLCGGWRTEFQIPSWTRNILLLMYVPSVKKLFHRESRSHHQIRTRFFHFTNTNFLNNEWEKWEYLRKSGFLLIFSIKMLIKSMFYSFNLVESSLSFMRIDFSGFSKMLYSTSINKINNNRNVVIFFSWCLSTVDNIRVQNLNAFSLWN